MIRGFIDFDTLDRTQNVDRLTPSGDITLPGLQLQFGGDDVRAFGIGQQLLLLQGQPRFHDAALAGRIERDGWGIALAALLEAPDAFLRGLRGRFALLWLDLGKGRIGLASDRFNTFGFCYASEGRRLSFADKANEVPALRREISAQSVFDYLYFHAIPAPGTIFENIFRLEPGARLVADSAQPQLAAWWQPRFEEPTDADFARSADTFKSLIKTAVERELDGRPVGAFLSGGTDSSTVVGMLARSGNPVTAYSIGFEAEGYDEMEFAKIAAKHFGVNHRPYYITSDDLVTHIPGVAASYDQPFGNSSVLPAYLCAKLAHDDGHRKMFAGDGGDELFGGNTRYAKQRVFGYYEKVPGLIKGALLEPVIMQTPLGKLPLMRKAASYIEQANTPLPERTAQYNLIYRLGMDNVFPRDFLSAVDPDAPVKLQRRVWQNTTAHALVNKMLSFDWRFTLADNDLPKVIGSTRLAGVDAIFPMLDDDLLDFSLQLPPEYKLKGLQLRWFFKEALRDFLPQEIITKKKQGFGLPYGHWVLKHKGLEALARESLDILVQRNILRKDFVSELFTTHLPAFPGYYGEMVWISMMLGQWLDKHAPTTR
ncbi:asparagine synthetase B [Zoogloea sp.]|uniref:asparagine synthetase B family protein n=1 Tax=Zoogloea sp. TaxID=49181 RepID=UPI0035B177B1